MPILSHLVLTPCHNLCAAISFKGLCASSLFLTLILVPFFQRLSDEVFLSMFEDWISSPDALCIVMNPVIGGVLI